MIYYVYKTRECKTIMKKIVIKLEPSYLSLIRETKEERKERIKYSACTRTRVVESKKKYNRSKSKQKLYKENFNI